MGKDTLLLTAQNPKRLKNKLWKWLKVILSWMEMNHMILIIKSDNNPNFIIFIASLTTSNKT